jgi:formate hydrogenlyase transcriptional activator
MRSEKSCSSKINWNRKNIHLRNEIELEYRYDTIVGKSPGIKEILRQAERVAASDTCVLILGETGTGKELIAHAIHNMSPRKARVMIKVNCAALPTSLIESELFGHEKGAYTGALTKQIGRFEAANGSTIFLDEIGDLPMEIQVKLLRVLQDGGFEHLGSTKTISADVRIVAATNRNLATLVKEGKFRKDLYYRLNVFPIVIPPLRERRGDIPLLVRSFIEELCTKKGKSIKSIPKKVMNLLMGYSWPGNIRELRNVIERGIILSNGPKLCIERLNPEEHTDYPEMGLDEIQKMHITKVLESTGWRIYGEKGAGKILNIKPSTLQYKMKRLNIEKPILE